MKGLVILFFTAFILASCTTNIEGCTEELKVCPDGSTVSRVGPECEFEECLNLDCHKNDRSYTYIGESKEACETIRFACDEGQEYFSDDCGCGCKTSTEPYFKSCPPELTGPGPCTREFVPVCGNTGTDLVTYSNECEACRAGVVGFAEGKCEEDANDAEKLDVIGCPDKFRGSDICTLEYFPVCGYKSETIKQTYSNVCSACVNDDVIGYLEGSCEELEEPKKSFCDEVRPEFCTEIYMPSCGWFSEDIQCVKYPCASTYSNSCYACMDENVEYTTEGECPS